jgi:hypothetical protein
MTIKREAIKIEDENLKRLAGQFLAAKMVAQLHPNMGLEQAIEFMEGTTKMQDLFWGNIVAEHPEVRASMAAGWDWVVGRNAIGEVYIFPTKPFPWAEQPSEEVGGR